MSRPEATIRHAPSYPRESGEDMSYPGMPQPCPICPSDEGWDMSFLSCAGHEGSHSVPGHRTAAVAGCRLLPLSGMPRAARPDWARP